jgi:hypothetical protein
MEQVTLIELGEWNDLVEKTYGRPYNFQQQDGCVDRGLHTLTVPNRYAEDFDNDEIPEVVNGDEMGVSLEAWLERDPKLNVFDREYANRLWWERNFYPDVDIIANDLHRRGVLKEGEYVIEIDW